MMSFRLVWVLCILLCASRVEATHNRAGEITYRHLGGFQYEATIITYTKASSPADRPSVGINWGDGIVDTILRVNGNGLGELVADDIKKNVYIGIHTYPGPANYILSFEDPNRNGGVVNIPNSVNIPFYVSTLLIINPFLGVNSSVQLLNPPIDEACAGQIFIHNPGAFDPDGDSISYRLTNCLGELGSAIAGFGQPASTNSFTLDAITGDLIWDTPTPGGIGEYNVAFVIEEWRQGNLIGFVTRDMQINVVPCQNTPPVIQPIPDICVTAGDTVSFTVTATDSDFPAQMITLSATGGPLLFDPPYTAVFPSLSMFSQVSQDFSWITACLHVRKQPYLVTFKAIDNGNPNLADFESVNITVVAEGPDTLIATPEGNTIRLEWTISPCSEASAYAIYRRNGSYPFEPAECQTGVPAFTGYSLIDTVNGINTLSYTDGISNELVPGSSYCYRVIALFPDGAESYTSPEACAYLKDARPVITHVSIEKTSSDSGRVYLEWSKPNELDTIAWPGPYSYKIQRASGINGNQFVELGSLSGLNDTIYIDSVAPLNTENVGLNYRILLFQEGNEPVEIARSLPSSSVFLSGNGSDNAVNLSWTYNVLWQNDSFIVYRKNEISGMFDSIGVANGRNFRDGDLTNGQTYCYKVESIGRFTADGYAFPIRNFSQELCVIAQDLTPPCQPTVQLLSSCDSLKNSLAWELPDTVCLSDVVRYTIYFKPQLDADFEILQILPTGEYAYIHLPGDYVAGCYKVTASDSAGNESTASEVCTDNCPEYELPNVFTPNLDGLNDAFRPFPYRFIDHVEFTVFNRWGTEVFYTEDPALNWNGRIRNSGALLPDGVYYYICIVYEQRLEGLVPRTLKGTIQLLNGSENQAN
jgi:gliding motility-associated-like protein